MLHPHYRDFLTTMGSADFSPFVVTTANGTAGETSPLKVRALSPHLSAAFTGASGNFWTSSLFADLSVFSSLLCDSCPSDQGFAYSFLQIPPHDGHPCCSAMCFVVAYAHSGLSPVRARPWRANVKKRAPLRLSSFSFIFTMIPSSKFYNLLILLIFLLILKNRGNNLTEKR